ncbi:hypothetical protein [Lonepinella sp. BR2474]|uniref:hypothetical protein n=1 Tax=Lonepinella sp. BR2474 TaxID=3434548 RepID=UPI003F6DC9BD
MKTYQFSLSRAHVIAQRISTLMKETAQLALQKYSYHLDKNDMLYWESESKRQAVLQKIEDNSQQFLQYENDYIKFSEILAQLRKTIAQANQKTGISDRLTDIRLLDTQLSFLNDIQQNGDVADDNATDFVNEMQDRLTIYAKLETESARYNAIERDFPLLIKTENAEQTALRQQKMAQLKNQRIRLNDEIRDLNGATSIQIELDDAMAEALNLA